MVPPIYFLSFFYLPLSCQNSIKNLPWAQSHSITAIMPTKRVPVNIVTRYWSCDLIELFHFLNPSPPSPQISPLPISPSLHSPPNYVHCCPYVNSFSARFSYSYLFFCLFLWGRIALEKKLGTEYISHDAFL